MTLICNFWKISKIAPELHFAPPLYRAGERNRQRMIQTVRKLLVFIRLFEKIRSRANVTDKFIVSVAVTGNSLFRKWYGSLRSYIQARYIRWSGNAICCVTLMVDWSVFTWSSTCYTWSTINRQLGPHDPIRDRSLRYESTVKIVHNCVRLTVTTVLLRCR